MDLVGVVRRHPPNTLTRSGEHTNKQANNNNTQKQKKNHTSFSRGSDYYYAHRALRDVELDDINAEWGQLIENVQTDAAPVYHEDGPPPRFVGDVDALSPRFASALPATPFPPSPLRAIHTRFHPALPPRCPRPPFPPHPACHTYALSTNAHASHLCLVDLQRRSSCPGPGAPTLPPALTCCARPWMRWARRCAIESTRALGAKCRGGRKFHTGVSVRV